MSFVDDLVTAGFVFQNAGRGGVRHYALAGNRFLTYYVHVAEDSTGGVFSWELALGELCATEGLQVGANELLNVFLYPQTDVTVPPDVDAVLLEVERARDRLNALRLADPDR